MKQTAIEWLVEQLIEQWYFNKDIPKTFTNLDHLIHQAKAMEKEQMEEMYEHAMLALVDGNGHGEGFNEYYNETFKSE